MEYTGKFNLKDLEKFERYLQRKSNIGNNKQFILQLIGMTITIPLIYLIFRLSVDFINTGYVTLATTLLFLPFISLHWFNIHKFKKTGNRS